MTSLGKNSFRLQPRENSYLIMMARMELSRRSFAAARDAARVALETAEKEMEIRRAREALVAASVGEALAARLAGESVDSRALQEAFEEALALVTEQPGFLGPSRLLLQAALLLDRGDAALRAWRSYFHAGPGQSMPNDVAPAGAELERILPGWTGPGASDEDRIALIEALEGSRLHQEGALVALSPDSAPAVRQDRRVRAVILYAETQPIYLDSNS